MEGPPAVPFCEAVHPLPPEPIGQHIDCSCGATAFLCAPKTEPTTAVWLAKLGLSDTFADVVGRHPQYRLGTGMVTSFRPSDPLGSP